MKKLIPFLIIGILILTGCAKSSAKDENKTYDDLYLKTLAASLNSRWEYTDSDEYQNDSEIDTFIKPTNIEIETLQKGEFDDKKFQNSELKELALSYMNELKRIQKIFDTESEEKAIEAWDEHYDNRTKILSKINAIKEIPVNNKKTLKELLNNGNDVQKDEKLTKQINILLKNTNFVEQPKEFVDSDYTEYEAIMENTTVQDFKDFSAKVYLEDESGTRIDTQSVYISDWTVGQKSKVKFTTDQPFSKMKVVLDFYNI